MLVKKKIIYDSFDDEEGNDEGIDYYISPNSLFIKIFDLLVFLASMFYFIFVPYFMSKNFFVTKEINSLKLILILIDVLYILDVIINFFRAYQNFDENLIRKTNKIILHYLKTWFFLDLIQAIPYFSLIQLFEKMTIMNNQNVVLKGISLKHKLLNPLIYNLIIIKIIKVYKMLNYNSTISYISEIFSRDEILERYGSFIIIVLLSISCLNMCTCLFIFLGKNSYPNWIIKINIQDQSHINIFLAALYFIIVTITSVGYGDITGDSIPELIFQVLLLIIGTIAYSFIISYISNYIIKSNKKSMTFEKHLEILQEIKVHHPNMDNTLYHEVLRNLYNEQLYEKRDKHILFDCLPYSLKNKLIMEMYKPTIENFVFFKDINNADFIVKVITSLKPLLSIKDDIIIQEGDFVKEIIFVKKGIISLNINIDLDNIKDSIRKFLGKNKIGKFDVSYMSSEIIRKRKNKINLDNALSSIFISSNDGITDNYQEDNIEQIKIIEIRRNEHFGDALMFLNDPCPLVAKVRTKIAELLILRKIEAIEIYSIYPNIWKRINKKSLYNMDQIYSKIRKIIVELSNKYNIKLGKKTSNKHIKKRKSRKKTIKEDKQANKNEKIEDNPNLFDYSNNLTFGDNNNSKIKKSMTSDKHNKRISKFSKFSNEEDNKKNNKKINNNQTRETKSINQAKTAKFESKSNSTNSLYKANEINDEIYENEIFDYNNNQKPELIHKLSKESKEYLNESVNYINLDDSIKSSFFRNNQKLLSNKTSKQFLNLNIIQENSFLLNSSYDNINSISDNKYISDKSLQSKTKDFIINECFKSKTQIKSNMFLNVPKSSEAIPFLNNKNIKNKDYRYSDGELSSNKVMSNIKRIETRKSDTSKLKNIWFNNTLKYESKKSLSTNKLTEIKNSFSKNIKMKNTIDSPCKIKRKIPKKNQNLNKKLNVISKNIQNTNEAINNPNEFYVNFFNDIIRRSGYGEQESEDEVDIKSKKEKKKLLHFPTGKNNNIIHLSEKDN